jgi:DNA-3-methyladenine glycosylase I
MQKQDHEHWKMPEWWYRGKRPSNDEVYFENMSRVIFQAGLNWQVIDGKWPSIKKAFSNFAIGKIACYTEADVERLMNDPEVIRNKGKIKAIIQNAQNFKTIEKQYGSFQKYLDSQDKSTTTKTWLKI